MDGFSQDDLDAIERDERNEHQKTLEKMHAWAVEQKRYYACSPCQDEREYNYNQGKEQAFDEVIDFIEQN